MLAHWSEKVDVILTDPVWPNALPELAGSHEPEELLSNVLCYAPDILNDNGRIIIHMRRDSDPRILSAVPMSLNFMVSAILPYAVPSRKGRILNSYDIAYLYGKPPASRPGNRILPGQIHPDFCPAALPTKKLTSHPCPRQLTHVEWLIEKFTNPDDLILDPFMGSGTTGIAALNRGRRFIGIEIDHKYWLEAEERLRKET